MSRYAFRAGAAAAGGFFTRPFTEPLPVQAASFLMPVGGYGSARVEHFRFHEIVSFKAGYTQVMGTRHEEGGIVVHETLAAAVVEGLNILREPPDRRAAGEADMSSASVRGKIEIRHPEELHTFVRCGFHDHSHPYVTDA